MEDRSAGVHGDVPAQDEGLEIVRRLAAGDSLAPSDVAVAYLSYLVCHLRKVEPSEDDDMIQTAAEDAILALIRRPEIYDPGRGSLTTFLRMAAGRDLQNARRSRQRHRLRQVEWGAVELSPDAGKYLGDDSGDPGKVVEMRERVEELAMERFSVPGEALEGLSAQEREAAALVLIKERRTERYVELLGLDHLPPTEQRAEVKRFKDMVKKRLARAGMP